jgi:hypothetical protein
MGQMDPTGLLYQGVAQRHIKGLMTKFMPLHEYFDSPLAHIPQDEDNLRINMAVFDQKDLISKLCSYVDKDITYLDLPVVKKIIGYKWQDHARPEYIKEFYYILLFAVSYIAAFLIGRNNNWATVSSVFNATGTIACILLLKIEMN